MSYKSIANPRKALLVIDIQEDYTGSTATPPFPYKNSEQLIRTVNQTIDKAAQKDLLIVYIRQEFTGFAGKLVSKMLLNGRSIEGNPGTAIDHRINIVSENIFPKPMASAFSNPKFEKFLDDHQITELYLTGLDAEFCIYATGKSALRTGYRVSIIKDGVALRAEHKWEALLKKYERDGIRLLVSEEFLK